MKRIVVFSVLLVSICSTSVFAATPRQIVSMLSTSTTGSLIAMENNCQMQSMDNIANSATNNFKMAEYDSAAPKALQDAEGLAYCVAHGKLTDSQVGGLMGDLLALSAVADYDASPNYILPEVRKYAEYSKVLIETYDPASIGDVKVLEKDGLLGPHKEGTSINH